MELFFGSFQLRGGEAGPLIPGTEGIQRFKGYPSRHMTSAAIRKSFRYCGLAPAEPECMASASLDRCDIDSASGGMTGIKQ